MIKTETVIASPKWHFYVSLVIVLFLIALSIHGMFLLKDPLPTNNIILNRLPLISVICMALIFSYCCYGICCCKNDQITVGHDGVKVKLHTGYKFQLFEKELPNGQYKIQCQYSNNLRPIITIYDKQNTKLLNYSADYAFTNSHITSLCAALYEYLSKPLYDETEKYELTETSLKGKVREVTHYYVDNRQGTFKKAEKFYSALYNEAGKMIEEKMFFASGVVYDDEYYYYNPSGVLVGGKHQGMTPKNSEGYLFDFDTMTNEYELYNCKFDEKGNLIEKQHLHDDGSVYLISRYVYTDDNKLSCVKLFVEENLIEEFFYNDKGEEEAIKVYEDGILQFTCREKYNEYGNIISEESTNTKGEKIYSDVSEYDTNNNLISWRVYDSGALTEEKKYTNDSWGHCIKEVHICYSEESPSEIVTVYTNDKYGNYLSAMIYENGKLIGAKYRSYEYYE